MLFMGKSTISMAIFNSKLLVYQRVITTASASIPISSGFIIDPRSAGAGALRTWVGSHATPTQPPRKPCAGEIARAAAGGLRGNDVV